MEVGFRESPQFRQDQRIPFTLVDLRRPDAGAERGTGLSSRQTAESGIEGSWLHDDTVTTDGNLGTAHPASTSKRPLARRDRAIHEYLGLLPGDSLVVNIGCGVLRRFEKECPGRYLATDIRALPHVDFAADAAALPLADRSVDAVVALELLEHVLHPRAVLEEIARVLRPGGRVIISVPSTVPRHDHHDYWRFTAQGLGQLCSDLFENGEVHIFGGTFEALGCLAKYYTALVLHRAHLPSGQFLQVFQTVGYWLDRHSSWSTSPTALHTLAFDLLYTATTSTEPGESGTH